MKSAISRLSADEVKKHFPIQGEIESWFFRVEEISGGVYEASGTDPFGRKVSRSGVDPDSLLASCIEDAREILAREKRGLTRR